MPTVTEDPITAWAHCPDATCNPYEIETPAVRRTTSYTYIDRGGDFPGIESSTSSIVPGDDTQLHCETCGKPLELAKAPRAVYPNESGVDPNGLLGINPRTSDPTLAAAQLAAEQADAIADLRAQLAELREEKDKATA